MGFFFRVGFGVVLEVRDIVGLDFFCWVRVIGGFFGDWIYNGWVRGDDY